MKALSSADLQVEEAHESCRMAQMSEKLLPVRLHLMQVQGRDRAEMSLRAGHDARLMTARETNQMRDTCRWWIPRPWTSCQHGPRR